MDKGEHLIARGIDAAAEVNGLGPLAIFEVSRPQIHAAPSPFGIAGKDQNALRRVQGWVGLIDFRIAKRQLLFFSPFAIHQFGCV